MTYRTVHLLLKNEIRLTYNIIIDAHCHYVKCCIAADWCLIQKYIYTYIFVAKLLLNLMGNMARNIAMYHFIYEKWYLTFVKQTVFYSIKVFH